MTPTSLLEDMTAEELTLTLEQAKDFEGQWTQYRRSLQAELYRRFPVPNGKASKTDKSVEGFILRSKRTTTTKVVADNDRVPEFAKLYPEVFLTEYKFSRKGFKQLPDDTQRNIQLSGVISTSKPYETVEIERVQD